MISLKNQFIIIAIIIILFTGQCQGMLRINNESHDDNLKVFSFFHESTQSSSSLNLKKGDIVWRWVDETIFPLFKYFMHPLLFTGDIINNSYVFVEAHGGKDVCLSYFTEERIQNQAIFSSGNRLRDQYYKDEIMNDIIAFATDEERMDDKFMPLLYFDEMETLQYHHKNHNPNDASDPLSDKWYCTELIWTAYYNNGINIDPNDGPILPIDFHTSPYLQLISIY